MSRKIVGFDRKIEWEWLDFAAAQAVEEFSGEQMRSRLWDFLEGRVSAGSSGWNSDRGKVITVLMRIWGPGPGRYEELRRRALAEFDGSPPESRLTVHWALCLGSYPFFADVARITGQHLTLHRAAQLAEVRRRLIEGWGDRAIVRRATQRILRSMIDWGALRDGQQRGTYLPGLKVESSCPSKTRLLVEGLLLALSGESLPARKLPSHPCLFPFQLDVASLVHGGAKGPILSEREALGAEYLRLV